MWLRFFAPFQTGPEDHPASCTMGTGSFRGVKRPGRGVDHPPPYRTEVKEKPLLPSGPSWPVLWLTLPLLLPLLVLCQSYHRELGSPLLPNTQYVDCVHTHSTDMKNTDKSSLFWVVTRHMMVLSDVSVWPAGPSFKG